MDRLRPAVTAMCAAVDRYFGNVIRTLGDGIMAIFGAPDAREGHALLACEAALAMQEAFRPGGEIAIRVGLHSGEVVSGVLKLDQVKEQEAHGLTVHLASHLQQLATPGAIWITEDCCRLVRQYLPGASARAASGEGLSRPVRDLCLARPADGHDRAAVPRPGADLVSWARSRAGGLAPRDARDGGRQRPRGGGFRHARRGQEPALPRIRPVVSRPGASRAGGARPDLRPRDAVSAGPAVPACVVPDPAGGPRRDRPQADRAPPAGTRSELRRRPGDLPRIPGRRRPGRSGTAPRSEGTSRQAARHPAPDHPRPGRGNLA